jgi:phage tail-like protein
MVTGTRVDPLVSVSFFVEVQGVFTGTFRGCTGLGSQSEVIENLAAGAGGVTHIYKIPGVTRWTNIVLKRGVTDSMDVWAWRKQVEEGKVNEARKNGSIIMYDQTNTEVARWNFENGWPAKISGPNLDASTNEIAIEELEIAHEKLVREK